MARSIALKRSKSIIISSSRPRGSTTRSAASGVARRPPSHDGSSSSDHSSIAQDDAPYKNLRRRSSIQGSNDEETDERKLPPAVAGTEPEESGKRSDLSPASGNVKPSAKTISQSKKRKDSIAITTTTNDPSVARLPLTRSQRQKLNQVTPSPAQAASSPAFSFQSPPPSKRRKCNVFDVSPKVPHGVVDLYLSKGNTQLLSRGPTLRCTCNDDACSGRNLTASFIQVYGHEYYSSMKENEDPIRSPHSSRSSSQESHVSGRQSVRSAGSDILQSPPPVLPEEEEDSLVSRDETPTVRRVWVSIDTPNISVIKAVESARFLEHQPELTPKMRSILMDWIIELSDHFNFGPSTLHLACTLVDQVLACGPLSFDDEDADEGNGHWEGEDAGESRTNCFLISRDRFQLLGATCTWLACKMEELSPPKVAQIAYISDNIYSVEQIKRMERRVCNALGFALVRQTPYPYIHEFMRASSECPDPGCESQPVLKEMVQYLLELGRLPYMPVTQKPSLLAAAAVYLSRVTLGLGGGEWTATLEYYTGYSKSDLKDMVLCIHSYQMAAEDSSLKSVFDKYRSKKHRRVALKTVPRREDLGFDDTAC